MISRGGQLFLIAMLGVMLAVGTWATDGRVNWGALALVGAAWLITWRAHDERSW